MATYSAAVMDTPEAVAEHFTTLALRVGATEASLENGVMRRLNSIDHSLATTYTSAGALQVQVNDLTSRPPGRGEPHIYWCGPSGSSSGTSSFPP